MTYGTCLPMAISSGGGAIYQSILESHHINTTIYALDTPLPQTPPPGAFPPHQSLNKEKQGRTVSENTPIPMPNSSSGKMLRCRKKCLAYSNRVCAKPN